MVRLSRLLVVGALLVTMTGVPAAGQDTDEDGSLAVLCASAPDEAIRESCLDLIAPVLPTAKPTTPWEDFEAQLGEALVPYSATRVRMDREDFEAYFGEALAAQACVAWNEGSFVVREDRIEIEYEAMEALRTGVWFPRDPETGRDLDLGRKKQARRARAVAGMAADDLRGLLMSTTADDRYEGVYAALWGLSSAWHAYADGRGSFEHLVRPALDELGRASSAAYCDPMWHIEVGPPETIG